MTILRIVVIKKKVILIKIIEEEYLLDNVDKNDFDSEVRLNIEPSNNNSINDENNKAENENANLNGNKKFLFNQFHNQIKQTLSLNLLNEQINRKQLSKIIIK